MLDYPPPSLRRHITGPSTVRKRSISIAGQKTSISMEDVFWKALKGIAQVRQIPLSALVSDLDLNRPQGSTLSSAARVLVLTDLQRRHDELARLTPG